MSESRSVYDQVYDGEWFRFGETPRTNRRMKIACCDCGLVHETKLRVLNGIVYMQVNRMPKETGGRRRALWKEKQEDD